MIDSTSTSYAGVASHINTIVPNDTTPADDIRTMQQLVQRHTSCKVGTVANQFISILSVMRCNGLTLEETRRAAMNCLLRHTVYTCAIVQNSYDLDLETLPLSARCGVMSSAEFRAWMISCGHTSGYANTAVDTGHVILLDLLWDVANIMPDQLLVDPIDAMETLIDYCCGSEVKSSAKYYAEVIVHQAGVINDRYPTSPLDPLVVTAAAFHAASKSVLCKHTRVSTSCAWVQLTSGVYMLFRDEIKTELYHFVPELRQRPDVIKTILECPSGLYTPTHVHKCLQASGIKYDVCLIPSFILVETVMVLADDMYDNYCGKSNVVTGPVSTSPVNQALSGETLDPVSTKIMHAIQKAVRAVGVSQQQSVGVGREVLHRAETALSRFYEYHYTYLKECSDRFGKLAIDDVSETAKDVRETYLAQQLYVAALPDQFGVVALLSAVYSIMSNLVCLGDFTEWWQQLVQACTHHLPLSKVQLAASLTSDPHLKQLLEGNPLVVDRGMVTAIALHQWCKCVSDVRALNNIQERLVLLDYLHTFSAQIAWRSDCMPSYFRCMDVAACVLEAGYFLTEDQIATIIEWRDKREESVVCVESCPDWGPVSTGWHAPETCMHCMYVKAEDLLGRLGWSIHSVEGAKLCMLMFPEVTITRDEVRAMGVMRDDMPVNGVVTAELVEAACLSSGVDKPYPAVHDLFYQSHSARARQLFMVGTDPEDECSIGGFLNSENDNENENESGGGSPKRSLDRSLECSDECDEELFEMSPFKRVRL